MRHCLMGRISRCRGRMEPGILFFVMHGETVHPAAINVDLYFFIAQDGDVKMIDPASAEDIPEFAGIRENRGWIHRGRPRNSD